MTDDERRVWLQTLCEDLGHLSDAEVSYGCARYRRDPKNRFFPTPGQLLAACKSPYGDPVPRRYPELCDLPPPATPDRVERMLQASHAALKHSGGKKTLTQLKEEILARPPLVMTPELAKLEKDLAPERLEYLANRLKLKSW